ncbi:uncharacterized protein LOC124936161 [Impatiens glandulifera]|uniref:uncharacterized protein LOC124936161 n=1 Tax=Impatiens glandulifera TaxID=253017 RepID=UPI001FB141BD|nr:uncharacterized protein LOC124936161 [Impatiens glandulifera]
MAEEQIVGSEMKGEMKPWEQHSSVITLPRFDYKAPSSLLQHSHSGFLVTCPFKREKSATKEAISILQKYIDICSGCNSEDLNRNDIDVASKKRKICVDDAGVNLEDDSCVSDKTIKNVSALSLVKLIRSGLLLFTLPQENSCDVVQIVSAIDNALESGSLSPLLWCNRIFPIQTTSCLNEKELHDTVTKLVKKFVNGRQMSSQPIMKFAVGYNRRGFDEKERKSSKNTSIETEELSLLDRNKCFSIVAGAVKDVVSDAVVDLVNPELSVLVELLPVSGLPTGNLVVAVSVLPRTLVTTKPKLCIKALLVSDDVKKGDVK